MSNFKHSFLTINAAAKELGVEYEDTDLIMFGAENKINIYVLFSGITSEWQGFNKNDFKVNAKRKKHKDTFADLIPSPIPESRYMPVESSDLRKLFDSIRSSTNNKKIKITRFKVIPKGSLKSIEIVSATGEDRSVHHIEIGVSNLYICAKEFERLHKKIMKTTATQEGCQLDDHTNEDREVENPNKVEEESKAASTVHPSAMKSLLTIIIALAHAHHCAYPQFPTTERQI